MVKSIRYEKQILIVLLWSILILIGYNVLTVDASSKYDKDEWVSGVTPDEWSDAEKYSDDSREQAHRWCAQLDYYDNNKKFCEKLAKGEENTVFATEQGLKGEELEKEIAAQEDALCDNEDADTTKIEICMSDKQKESKKIGKDECKEVNGDWKYGRCTFYEDYQSYEEEQQKQEDKAAEAEDLPNKLSPYYNSEPALSKEEKEDFEEGKRYVNPDGGAPLYEDEVTEDEKDYYEEYKPEKEEEPPVIYDGGCFVA